MLSKVLVIVESPAKAKTIGRFLGKKYTVKSSMGHIRDLPKSQMGVDLDNGFEPKYITIRGKGELLRELKTAAKKSDFVLLATDPDREGEAIAWHLQQLLGIAQEANCRIEFNEITKEAIQKAARQPRKVDYNRVDAQQARRVLDRLVGYGLSPLLWKKVRKGLSAGRVQSVAVRLICDREKEITEFIPEEYWSLTAKLKNAAQNMLEAKLYKKHDEVIKITSEQAMQTVLDELQDSVYVVRSVRKKEKKRSPAPPFTTSSMQQEAYRKLNFTARKTMMVAQQLYEGIDIGKKEGTVGLITYLRTDSTRIAEIAQNEARAFITERFGRDFIPPSPRQFLSKKQAQNAHEAIRPTSTARTPESLEHVLSKDQFKLYKLIWERFVSSQMSSAVLDTTTVEIAAGAYVFRTSGAIIKFPGFMKVYTESRDNEAEEAGILPEIEEGETLKLQALLPKQHFTQPPPRYSEATLVKTLEELGIGRPSTYAPIIETILHRGYVTREQKQFAPTELGIIVVEILKEFFPDIIDVEFTATMENNLDKVEEGNLHWQSVVGNFYAPFTRQLKHAEQEIGTIEIEDEVSDELCEKCGRNMVIKMGRFGKFLACPGFPECRNTKPLLEEIGVQCPLCDGKIVARRTKKGRKFFGCSKYPACNFVAWDKPSNEMCPQCHSVLLEKKLKNETRLVCSKEGCKFQKQLGKG